MQASAPTVHRLQHPPPPRSPSCGTAGAGSACCRHGRVSLPVRRVSSCVCWRNKNTGPACPAGGAGPASTLARPLRFLFLPSDRQCVASCDGSCPRTLSAWLAYGSTQPSPARPCRARYFLRMSFAQPAHHRRADGSPRLGKYGSPKRANSVPQSSHNLCTPSHSRSTRSSSSHITDGLPRKDSPEPLPEG